MKLSELSERKLAAVVAGAGVLGGLVSSLLSIFLVDAGTERQTDVQLVQLAIGILSEPLPAEASSPSTALRAWAVDTINAAAEVKFDEEGRQLLIDGELSFETPTSASWTLSGLMSSLLPEREVQIAVKDGLRVVLSERDLEPLAEGQSPPPDRVVVTVGGRRFLLSEDVAGRLSASDAALLRGDAAGRLGVSEPAPNSQSEADSARP